MSERGAEAIGAEEWLTAKLGAEPTLISAVDGRIFWGVAPPKTLFPFVTFNLMANSIRRTIGGRIVWIDLVYLVTGVDEGGSPARLVSVASGIHTALERQRGETANLIVVSCYRTAVHAPPPVIVNDDLFSNLGGQYRIRIRHKPGGTP